MHNFLRHAFWLQFAPAHLGTETTCERFPHWPWWRTTNMPSIWQVWTGTSAEVHPWSVDRCYDKDYRAGIIWLFTLLIPRSRSRSSRSRPIPHLSARVWPPWIWLFALPCTVGVLRVSWGFIVRGRCISIQKSGFSVFYTVRVFCQISGLQYFVTILDALNCHQANPFLDSYLSQFHLS